MNSKCHTVSISALHEAKEPMQSQAISQLEEGKVIFLPNYPFTLTTKDNQLLTDKVLDGKHKNVSFNYQNKKLGGYNKNQDLEAHLSDFMQRYAEYSHSLILTLLPQYKEGLIWGRTSYRPAEIKDRVISKRKDDTRLHVDSFPSTPVNGLRILRVFCNINPTEKPRVWHVGEPFTKVLEQFSKQIPPYNYMKAKLLHWLKATKSLRSAYDHYMLSLHDTMKLDDNYQQTVDKTRIDFPAYSSWIVFTDHVSHAALGGQYLLEQTFYLPVEAMATPHHSPYNQWKHFKKNL